MTVLRALLAIVVGYLFGSVPSGVLVARLYGNVDLTKVGSGRTGATNVLRTLGPVPAAIAFAGDLFKGVLAVRAVNRLADGQPWAQLLATIGAVVGHAYSPFIGFKGGRGVVTGIGATAVIAPREMLAATGSGVVLIALTRYVSLGSIVGATVGGLLMVRLGLKKGVPAYVAWGLLVAGFIVGSHRDNMQRLLNGTERKLGKSEPTV